MNKLHSTHSFKHTAIFSAIATASLFGASQIVVAQENFLEEVVVTAQFREQSMQDIPFNISAVDGRDLAAKNIVDASELMRTVAGVSLVDRGHRNSGNTNSLVIRGINVESGISGDVGQSTVPTVSTYVDSTPLFANFILKDIERVEILRGPQGTLYGSGALGGTVRYIMNKPSSEEFEGNISVGAGQTSGSDGNNMNTDVMLNIPLSDTLAVRVSAGNIDNDGVIDMPNLYQLDDGGVPLVMADNGSCLNVDDASLSDAEIANNGSCYESRKDADYVDIWYARAALRFEPSDDFALTLTYQIQEDEVGHRRAVTTGDDFFGNPYGDNENGSTLLEPSEREVEMTTLELAADLGFATLTSNTSLYDHRGTGWRDNTSLWVTDRNNGVGFVNWFDILYTGNPRPAAHVESGYQDEALVQEFRLVSNTEDDRKIDWIAGLYYMDQDRTTTNFSHLRGLEEYGNACVNLGAACVSSGAWWAGVDAINDMDFSYIRKESFTDLGVYGEMTYHFSDVMRVTGGVRWFDNELTNSTSTWFAYLQPTDIPFVDFPSQEEDDVLFKLNASLDLESGAMVYATYSEGFRRGGSNAIPTAGPFTELNPSTVETYGKDSVANYELGIKGEAENIRYSADVYYVDWQDPQLNTGTAWWGFFMAQNGGAAKTTGIELEASIGLSENMRVNLGYAFAKGELTEDLIQPQNGSVIAESGQRLPGTSEHVFSVSADYSTTLGNGLNLDANLSAYYQSDSVNSIQDNYLQQEFDGFSLLNASVALSSDQWMVTFYAKNLLDEEGVTGSYPAGYLSTDTGVFENYYGNNQKEYITNPRTMGINVGYSF